MADVTDLAPTAVSIGAQLGSAAGLAAATGGASLLAQVVRQQLWALL